MRLVSWLGNLLGGGGGGLDGVEQQRSGPPGDIFYIAPVVLSTRRQTWTGTVAAVVVVQDLWDRLQQTAISGFSNTIEDSSGLGEKEEEEEEAAAA